MGVTPTPVGCQPMTPPPGSLGATQCNFDAAFGPVDNVFMAIVLFVFVPIALLLVAAGIFALVTAKGPLPLAIYRALPREPDSARDHRLQGLSLTLAGVGLLVSMWFVQLNLAQPSPPRPVLWVLMASFASLALFVAGAIVGLAVRQRHHGSLQVMSGWEQIARVFRA